MRTAGECSHTLRCSWVGNKQQRVPILMLGSITKEKREFYSLEKKKKKYNSLQTGWMQRDEDVQGRMSRCAKFNGLEVMVMETFSVWGLASCCSGKNTSAAGRNILGLTRNNITCQRER